MRSGLCFRDRKFRIHVAVSPVGISRLGLVVSRKVGNAVERNRVKRRLREVFRASKARLPSPLDVVVVCHPPAAGTSHEEFRELFDRFLRWCDREGPEAPRERPRGNNRKE